MADDLAWPDDKKSIFSLPASDPHSPTWCSIEWLSSWSDVDEGFLSSKFKIAADHIIEHLKTGQSFGHPDGLFMPIAYLYRHSLELQLKHLVRLGLAAFLVEDSAEIQRDLGRHDLLKLWCHGRAAIEKRWPDDDKIVINNTQALIRDFQMIDKSGQNLRYTRDSQDRPTALKYPESIELIEFQRVYEGVHNLLGGCASEFGSIVNYIADAEREG